LVCRTALFCSFHRYEKGLGGPWENAISLMVIGLSYSEELNCSDGSYRYRSSPYDTCSSRKPLRIWTVG